MTPNDRTDDLFVKAVVAIDRGDVTALRRILVDHPDIVSRRLESPGPWLRQAVGNALDGFFAKPYLLWFIAEDPVRNGTLPANIVEITRLVVDAARLHAPDSFQSQLDYTLLLVAWSPVAAKCGVQLELLDALVQAGADPAANADNALVNGHIEAARHLIRLGGRLTLASAVCLDRRDDFDRLFAAADAAQKQFTLVLAALNGKADGVRWLLETGVPANRPSADLHSHGMPLHHAVCSGSLDTVKALVDAGADTTARDTAWNGTPLGWAEHYVESSPPERRARFAAIVEYLRSMRPNERDERAG